MENSIFINKECDTNFINEIKKIETNHNLVLLEEKENNIEILEVISNTRTNIISWYPFKEKATILEIGADFGQLTECLCKKAKKVYSFEINEKKRYYLIDRTEGIRNLLILESLDELKEKVDYITLIGLENITNSPKELLKYVKKFLKEDGVILLATNNKFGVKYFSTQETSGETISNFVDKKLYSLETLNKFIKEAGFENSKVYFPMTNYKFPNAIFTNDERIAKSNLSRNIVYNRKGTIKFYEQNELYSALLSEDSFSMEMFANSFFVEIFNDGNIVENNIRMVTYSNMRKDKYKIMTIIKNDFVYKYAVNKKSISHIKNVKENIDIMKKYNIKTVDSYDEERIISKYTKDPTLDKVIIQKAKENIDDALELILKYKNELYSKFENGTKKDNVFEKYDIECSTELLNQMNIKKYGLWDLIFQNCFYINDDFYYYDQEWKEENVPVEFIIYRAIKYFSELREFIKVEELYKKLNITPEMIEIFDILDDKLQEEIRDELTWKIHRQGTNVNEIRIQKLTDNHNMNLMKIEIDKLITENKNLKKEVKNLNDRVKNNIGWHILKPVRALKNKMKRKE